MNDVSCSFSVTKLIGNVNIYALRLQIKYYF
jgi:hypothetical protein